MSSPTPERATPRFGRRALLGGALGAAATTTLSACGSPLAAGLAGGKLAPGTVQYWNLFGGGDGARMVGMEQVYQQNHGGPSSLQAATFAWGNPYYTKLSLATLGGSPPDVAVSHLTRATNLARGNLLSEITDADLASVGLSQSDFSAKPLAKAKTDGKLYAIPLDTHPFVLYYNSDVCQKAGLLDSDGLLKPIHGVQEFEAALTAAKKVTGAYGLSVATIGDTATCWRWFTTLYHQQNGATPFLGNNGKELTFNEDLTIKTLEYMQSLTKRGLVPTTNDYAGAETMLFTGKVGFYLEGEWEITTAQSVKGFKFGMAPIPTLFDTPAAQGDSHSFVLPRQNWSESQRKLAMGFVKSMLDQSLAWAKGGHIPAYKPTLDSQEYKNLTPQKYYAGVADYVVYDAPAWYSGSGSTFENIIGAQIGLVEQGIATPKQGLDAAVGQLKTYVNTADPLA
ncbi:MAG TPA: extracellular solute-binding protein [Propionibacteriaceae bacterium]|nr:extracellular solute-binding protein [Propionibacteriaceae bacterium]